MCVKLLKASWMGGVGLSVCDVGRMFRSSWHSARYTGGEAEAAPLAAGGSQSELGVASVRFHSLEAECLELLTFWKSHKQTGQRLPSSVRIASTQHFLCKLLHFRLSSRLCSAAPALFRGCSGRQNHCARCRVVRESVK